MTRGIYTMDLVGAGSHGTERGQRVSSSSPRGREDAPRPVQTSVPTATDMFEQIVQDKPACFGNEPLSLGVRTVPYICVHVRIRPEGASCLDHEPSITIHGREKWDGGFLSLNSSFRL